MATKVAAFLKIDPPYPGLSEEDNALVRLNAAGRRLKTVSPRTLEQLVAFAEHLAGDADNES